MRTPILLAVLTLAACADPAAVARHQARLNAHIGQSETELVRQLGVPSRSYDADGHRFLAYTATHLDIWPGGPLFGFGRFGYGGGFPPQVVQWRCDTTFELVDGHVAAWTQRGNNC
jgi:hypothetical protein